MDYENNEQSCIGEVVLAILSTMLACTIVFAIIIFCYDANIKELGNAICTEQQNSTFDYYSEGVLHCKADQVTPYDGILISRGNYEQSRTN